MHYSCPSHCFHETYFVSTVRRFIFAHNYAIIKILSNAKIKKETFMNFENQLNEERKISEETRIELGDRAARSFLELSDADIANIIPPRGTARESIAKMREEYIGDLVKSGDLTHSA